ncbi:MAG: RNA pseudouridine synthase [Christensenellaceae bacterium]|jgi:23S rRNA pseudouridine1911/1915/1917 synthase|nr:RNA pseudouridine synthase [Christensenellaceae bacterium]
MSNEKTIITSYKDLQIIFEDNHLLVVLKPQNVPVARDSSEDLDLLNMLKTYLIESKNKPGDAFLGLVHRLDRTTGGVMVFAKTSRAAKRLAEQLQNGIFEKRYLAVTCGIPKEKHAILKNSLLKDEQNNYVSCVPIATEGSKSAVLEYKIVATNNGYALLDIKLLTGRSHQARVQLAYIGTPIMGDRKYGGTKPIFSQNLALWATELRIQHPVSKDNLVFRIEPPLSESPWNLFQFPVVL